MIHNESKFFPEDFEVDGGTFHLRAMDKRFKASSMESLEELDRICRLYDIPYYAYYGTLLGTIRHSGFIPWDDDLDVAMFREDYNKFIEVAPKELSKWFVLNHIEDSSFYPLRVQNGYSIELTEEFLQRFHYCPYPTGVDIYPIDKLPESEEEKGLLKLLFEVTRFVAQYQDEKYEEMYGHEREGTWEDISDILDGIEQALGVTLVRDYTLAAQLSKLCNRLAAIYNDTDSKLVTRVEIWATDGHREEMPIECFADIIMMPFEEMMVPVPVGYDTLLTNVYGDYMTPRPGGGAHEFGSYRENEELLINRLKELGSDIPEFLTV